MSLHDVIVLMQGWFDNNHPFSDLSIGLLAIGIWEALRFCVEILRTPKGKRGQLKGAWKGHGNDVYVANGKSAMAFDIELRIRVRSRYIAAKATLVGDDGKSSEKLELSGGFYDDRFLRLTYYNEGKQQQGVLFLELGPGCDYLAGTYTGYSPRRETIVAGTVRLTR